MPLLRLHTQQELAAFQQFPTPTLITVISDHRLTSQTLRTDIAPTVGGIEALGHASSYARHTDYLGSVSSISQDSPISINLTGLKDAVELALTYVLPWRREYAKQLAALEIIKRELEIERDSRNLDYDAEQRRLEFQRLQLEITKEKFELAERMLERIDPDSQLRGRERERALASLISGIDQLSTTRLEFGVVGDVPPK
jgi:hypothetical protein